MSPNRATRTRYFRVKLKRDEYVGYLKVRISNNTRPDRVMSRIMEEIEDGYFLPEEGLNPEYGLYPDSSICISVVLANPDGDKHMFEDNVNNLKYWVTGIELADLEV